MKKIYSLGRPVYWRVFPLFMCLVLLFQSPLFAQTDTEFWFAAPEVSQGQGDGFEPLDRPVILRITGGSVASTVTINQPAIPGFVPVNVAVPANGVVSFDLTPYIDQLETKPANTTLNFGLQITATSPVSIYYEVLATNTTEWWNPIGLNAEIYVLKGKSALGTSFITPFQNILDNSNTYVPTTLSSFDIVATLDNTEITITPSKAIVGHPAGVPFTITLNKGESYSARAMSPLAEEHLGGSTIISNKCIAVTIKDDLLFSGALLEGTASNTCIEQMGDQLVPINNTGTEYLVVKGRIDAPEKAFIVPTENATTITVNGVIAAIKNAGETFVVNLPTDVTSITTSKKSYALHLSGIGCEAAGAILPGLDNNGTALGNSQAGFYRTSSEEFAINVLVPTASIGDFQSTVNGVAASLVTAADFTPIAGTSWSYARKSISTADFPQDGTAVLSNTTSVFQLGIYNGGGRTGARYGYLSSYKNNSSCPVYTFSVTDTDIKCFGQNDGTITITVNGGTSPYTYTISGNPQTTGTFNGPSVTIPGFGPGTYSVNVTDFNGVAAPGGSATINQFVTALTATVTSQNLNCVTGAKGSITIVPSGGTAPYKISGTGIVGEIALPAAGITFNNLAAGPYTYAIVDANNCSITKTAVILEDGNCDQVCFKSPTNPTVVNGTHTWTFNVDGTITIKTTLAKTFVDNTYGTNAIGWPAGNHDFKHLVQSDQLQLGLYDAAGTKKMEFRMDYFSQDNSIPSKYRTLGVTGGDGALLLGSLSNIVKVRTSMSENFNSNTPAYYALTSNSPKTDANYTPNPTYPNWIYDVWYEVTVKPSAFGAAGFGYPLVTGLHASPSKTGNDSEPVVPSDCPGPLKLGDKIWVDANDNGVLDNGEVGVSGLVVKLYKDADANNVADGAAVASTTTTSTGTYAFAALLPGNYIVGVTLPANYTPAANLVFTPNNDLNNDNNGTLLVGSELRTNSITLVENGEPTTDGDGDNGNLTLDIGLKYTAPPCTNTTQHSETFPNQFNTGYTKSLSAKTFAGSSGTWTANSNSYGSVAVVQPGYSPSSSYAIEMLNYKTGNSSTGSSSAISPKLNITGTCCPAEQNLSFTLWTYVVTSGDTKASLDIDFSKDGGSTWTEVWSKSSADLFTLTGAHGKTNISIPIATTYQTSLFRYRIRGEMAKGDANNFFVFLDDISIKSPASCGTTRTATQTAPPVAKGTKDQQKVVSPVLEQLTIDHLEASAMPNPSRNDFKIELQGKPGIPVTIRLLDMSGRLLNTFTNLPSTYTFRLGSNLKRGSYFAEVIQGEDRKIIKLVKM